VRSPSCSAQCSVRYAAGEACKPGAPDPCAAGHYCRTGTGLAQLSGTCTPIPAAGEPCGTGFGAQCRTGMLCVQGVCQNLVPNGVSCTGDAISWFALVVLENPSTPSCARPELGFTRPSASTPRSPNS
jgi:hypothetical protein